MKTMINARLVMEFEDFRYNFNRFDPFEATDDDLHDLALKLNAFQAEKPPKKISVIVRSELM